MLVLSLARVVLLMGAATFSQSSTNLPVISPNGPCEGTIVHHVAWNMKGTTPILTVDPTNGNWMKVYISLQSQSNHKATLVTSSPLSSGSNDRSIVLEGILEDSATIFLSNGSPGSSIFVSYAFVDEVNCRSHVHKRQVSTLSPTITSFPTSAPATTPGPTYSPLVGPSDPPTDVPTQPPADSPTSMPTGRPTSLPSSRPTLNPTAPPSTSPPTGSPVTPQSVRNPLEDNKDGTIGTAGEAILITLVFVGTIALFVLMKRYEKKRSKTHFEGHGFANEVSGSPTVIENPAMSPSPSLSLDSEGTPLNGSDQGHNHLISPTSVAGSETDGRVDKPKPTGEVNATPADSTEELGGFGDDIPEANHAPAASEKKPGDGRPEDNKPDKSLAKAEADGFAI